MRRQMNSSGLIDAPAKTLAADGVKECERGAYREAIRTLEEAASLAGDATRLPAKALAAYGVALAATDKKRTAEGIRICQTALQKDPIDTDLHLYLARAYLNAKSKSLAIQALDAGLRAEPGHAEMRRLRARLGRRRPPPLAFLGRSHPVNVCLGKLRHRLLGGG